MDFNTLLGQLESQRPDLADSLAIIRQFQNEKKDNNSSNAEIDNSKNEELLALLEKHKRINRNLLQQYNKLEENYKLLIEQLDQLAEAIGACPTCWGEDINCNYCRGRGRPSYFQPNQDLFDCYIKPVILKLKTNKSQTSNSNN